MGDPIGIEFRGLYKIFGGNPAAVLPLARKGVSKAELNERFRAVIGLRDINLTMAPGKIQVIMGLSGSGKSTLIRHINRLIEPTAGEVLVGGEDVVKMSPDALRQFRRRQTAMVFQKFALLPNRTVLENASYGLEVQGVGRAERIRRAMAWVERVGLKGYESRYPNQLSGGMQQRVGLARALTNDAPILLMDEAFSALDPLIRLDMQSVMLELQKDLHKTVVFITHDLDEALRLGDSIAILRDGEIIQQGTSQDIVLRPADPYIESFVREVNRGRVIRAEAAMEPVPASGLPGEAIAGSASLEEAGRLMATRAVDRLVVTGPTGLPVGVLRMATILAAMTDRGGAAAS